jgi:hypothetical protein
MTNKLKLEYIDWSKAPEDAESAYIWGEGKVGYYKFNAEGDYMFKSTPKCGWQVGYGSPVYTTIKRPPNIFTKSMLVAGKHIVETVDGEIYVVFNGDDGDFLFKPTNEYGWSSLYEYNEDLRCDHFDNMYDIVKVYTTKGSNFCDKKRLTLIWERTPAKVPTQKELQLAALQDTINKAQEQIEELMKD